MIAMAVCAVKQYSTCVIICSPEASDAAFGPHLSFGAQDISVK